MIAATEVLMKRRSMESCSLLLLKMVLKFMIERLLWRLRIIGGCCVLGAKNDWEADLEAENFYNQGFTIKNVSLFQFKSLVESLPNSRSLFV